MSRLKTNLLPYIPVILLPVILFAGPILRMEALYWGTPALQFIPWRAFAWESLRDGVIPLWNPHNGMGAPLVANYQSALFYPPGWILFLFMAIGGASCLAWANTLLVILHLIWAGIGMARFLRSIGLGQLSQTVGALTFALGGYLVARSGFFSIVWTAAWLPWIMLVASQIGRPVKGWKESGKYIPLGLVVAIGMMLLAGHAQLSWYILLLASAWVISGGFLQNRFSGAVRNVIRFSAAATLGALLAAIQLLPTAEYLLQSQRSQAVDYDAALTYSFWPWRFLTLLAPDFFGNPGQGNYWGYANYWEDAIYIGVLPLLLALSTLFMLGFRRNRQESSFSPIVRFAWAIIAAGFLLALGYNTPVFPFLYQHIPTFNMFNAPARYLIWPLFSLSLLASIGVSRWSTPAGRGLYWLRLATAGGFSITLGAFLALFFLQEVRPTFIYATALAGVWGLGAGLLTLFMPASEQQSRRYVWQWLVVIWIGLDLLVAGWNNNPTIEIDFYRGHADVGNIEHAGKRVYLSTEDEYYLKFRRFLRFEDFTPIEDPLNIRRVLLPNLNLLDEIHVASNFDPMVPARYERWMAHLATLPAPESQSWLALMNVGLEEKIDMQESVGVRFDPVKGGERLRWYACAIYADGEDAAFDAVSLHLSTNRFDQLVLEGTAAVDECPPVSVDSLEKITTLSEQADKLTLQIETANPGWVFLADTWYPGWKARVNGEETEVLRANYLFRAVEVPAGVSNVEFRYRPTSFQAGAVITLGGWLFVLLSIIMMSGPSSKNTHK